MYLAVKQLHVTFVVVSITGFFLRGLLTFAGSVVMGRSWMRWAPHVNDTLLLAAAVALAVMSGQYPFVQDWLTAKIFGLIAYVILGSLALKRGRSLAVRLAAWFAALGAFGYVVSVALTKSPLGFLVWLGIAQQG